MHAKRCLLNFRVKAQGTDPSLPNSDECVQAPFISLSASELFASGESWNATVGLTRRMIIMPGVQHSVVLRATTETALKTWKSWVRLMTWFSFLSSTRVSLPSSQCSSIQRGPPTRSGTNRVQHIQSSGATSPHSSLRRVSILSCSCRLFFFFTSFLPAWTLVSFPLMRWKVVCLGQALRISRAMHASLTSRHNTLPYFFSMWINPQACFETCAYCTNSWEIWPCTSVSLRMAVLMVEWEALYSWAFGMEKKRKGPRSSPVWPSMAEWSGDKSSRAVNSEQSDLICCYSVILFFISFYFSIWCFFDSEQMDSKEAGWVGVHSQMYFIFFCYAVKFGGCVEPPNTISSCPSKKIHFYNLYRFTTKQS